MEAIIRAFEHGFSVETDLRDMNGEIVISHDPVRWNQPITPISQLFSADRPSGCILALNIKSDGLCPLIGAPRAGQFFFDMSAPEARRFSFAGHTVALRLSDIEPMFVPTDIIPSWVWLDSFEVDWLSQVNLGCLDGMKGLVVVSPELHGRDKTRMWETLAEAWHLNPNLCICTDYPFDFFELVSN